MKDAENTYLLFDTLLYAFTKGATNLTALTTSELTAATRASLGRYFSPSNGSLLTTNAKFSNVFAQLLTVVR